MKKPTFKLYEVIIIVFVSCLSMSIATGYVAQINKQVITKIDPTEDENVNNFIDVYNSILSNYFGDIDEEELIEAAINGMITKIDDPYTTYLNKYSKEFLLDGLKGTYEGIGIEITTNDDGKVLITGVLNNTPASKAGLLKDDIILSINGESLEEKTVYDATSIIKRNNDKTVIMEVLRNNELLEFNLERKDIYVPAVFSETFMRNNKTVGYLAIDKFSLTVAHQFKEKLKELEKQNIDSLIIDVRNNTGGYLMSAKDIIMMFLEEKEVIYSLKSKTNTTKYRDKTKEHRTYPVAVLINENSASASEVLAGAIKYSYGGTLIGQKTFGKGKVQQTSDVDGGSMIKYTSAEWLLPNGDAIDEIGINPDIQVKLSQEYYEDPSYDSDNQLQTAIHELTK